MKPSPEVEEKLERVARLLVEADLGGLLINSQHNFAWLTGGGTNGVSLALEGGVASLLIRRDGQRFVLASKIEMPRMLTEEVATLGYEPIEYAWEAERAQPTFVADQAQRLLATGAVLGTDLNFGGRTRPVEGLIARARYQLTDAELVRYRELGRDAGAALGEVCRTLTPGLTEREIARRMTDALAARGILAVVRLVAADERLARYRHPVPTEQPWEKVVMLVASARRHGLYVSLSRLVCLGAVPAELQQRTQATAEVTARLWAATRPGATGRDLYHLIAESYKDVGFPGEEQLHHQGGACGYKGRDWVAQPQSAEVVQARQAFAWNPSITGTKIEETIIAFDDSLEVLTATPDWPVLKISVAGREYQLPDVWSLV